jgi:hypothetical protein
MYNLKKVAVVMRTYKHWKEAIVAYMGEVDANSRFSGNLCEGNKNGNVRGMILYLYSRTSMI